MELVLRGPRGFIETINQVIHKKEENIYYEEKVYGGGISNDVKTDFIGKLRELGAGGKTLIITDPYLLVCRQPHKMLDFLINSIREIEPSRVIVAAPERNTCPYSLEYVSQKLGAADIRFEYKSCNKFHDRFWVVIGSGGFVIGTSFNGMLSNSIFYSNMLSSEDFGTIIEVLTKEGII